MEEKHFEEWIDLKEKLHFNAKIPKILEGEVWWCSFGENVGVEINGKSARFMSVSRLHSKLGRVPESDLEIVKKAFHELYK